MNWLKLGILVLLFLPAASAQGTLAAFEVDVWMPELESEFEERNLCDGNADYITYQVGSERSIQFHEGVDEYGCALVFLPLGTTPHGAKVSFWTSREVGAESKDPIFSNHNFEQLLRIYNGAVVEEEEELVTPDSDSRAGDLQEFTLHGAGEAGLGFWFADLTGSGTGANVTAGVLGLGVAYKGAILDLQISSARDDLPVKWQAIQLPAAGRIEYTATFQVAQDGTRVTTFGLGATGGTPPRISGSDGVKISDACWSELDAGRYFLDPGACPHVGAGVYTVTISEPLVTGFSELDAPWVAVLTLVGSLWVSAAAWLLFSLAAYVGGWNRVFTSWREPGASGAASILAAGVLIQGGLFGLGRSAITTPVPRISYVFGFAMMGVALATGALAMAMSSGWITSHRVSAQRAEHTMRSRESTLLKVAAHELRTPLAPMKSNLFMLRTSPTLSEEDKVVVADLERNALRFGRLVQGILDYDKTASGNLDIRLTEGRIITPLQSAFESFRIMLAEREIEVSLNVPEDLLCNFDSQRIEQVAVNLLDNARKFTGAGGTIALNAGIDGNIVWFEVVDSGAGIPASKLRSLAKPFSEGENHPSHTATGMGLGLSICQGIMTGHNGRLIVRSPGLGKGAAVRCELPGKRA